ncbi:Peptidoglycan D,D-transpeptidase MrdA [hydrothermal vent metagenome]|uniref:Peptidoglycan D,D-transpeptidase MrdA n=1 Tax=hydrothermal vent metagenome TaxID=652676 RepID=A0A3B0UWQ2_9ZZZZ
MKEYLAGKDPSELKERLYLALVVIAIIFLILIAKLWYLQVMRSSYFSELSMNNRIRLTKTPAARGLIMDRSGRLLAENRPGFDLLIVPEDVKDMAKTKKILTRIVDIDKKTINAKLKKAKRRAPFRPVKLKEDISWEEMAKVDNYNYEMPGVLIEVMPKRTYPYDEATAHLLGYLGEISERDYRRSKKENQKPYRRGDMIGKSGVESSFEKTLRGTDGGRQIEVDASGRLIRVMNEIPPYPGQNIRLTIDLATQRAAWDAMKGKTGAVVAIDPENGKILAMVSTPSFDSDRLTRGLSNKEWQKLIQDPMRVFNNRALQGLYPPASTFKPITAIAALEIGVIDEKRKIMAGPSFRLGRSLYRDWKRGGHGKINLHTAIVQSSDTFFYQLGLDVGIDGISHYAKSFGLGSKTGINIKNEKKGFVPSRAWKLKAKGEPWYRGETVINSIGQGFMLSTPMQLVNAYAAIANGGILYTPQFIESVESIEGKKIKDFPPVIKARVDAKPETLKFIREALRGVVSEKHGTARWINRRGLKIAGKTGTAQVVRMKERIKDIEKIPYKFRDHGLFAGFAPFDEPKIAVAVVIEHGGFGSSSAAPVALRVIKTYLEGLRDQQDRQSLRGLPKPDNNEPSKKYPARDKKEGV